MKRNPNTFLKSAKLLHPTVLYSMLVRRGWYAEYTVFLSSTMSLTKNTCYHDLSTHMVLDHQCFPATDLESHPDPAPAEYFAVNYCKLMDMGSMQVLGS